MDLSDRGVVRPVRIDPAGLNGPTRKQARGPRWRRTSHGLYVPSSVDAERIEQRIVEAAEVLPAYGGVTGWASLRWYGGVWFGGTSDGGRVRRPVTLALGGCDAAPQNGIAVSHERLHLGELEVVDGLRVTNVLRSLSFETRYASSLWTAVEAIDLAAYSDLVSISEFSAYVAVMTGWTGIDRCRRALALARENSWSPRETWLRLVCVLVAELPTPQCNVPVFDLQGRHVGTPDLFDDEVGVAYEYDGALHLQGAQRRRDLIRAESFRAVGLECVTVVAGDSDGEAADRMVAARRRAARLAPPKHAREWTLAQPSWWQPTDTVEARRSLDAEDRERWMALRLRVS